MCCDWRYEGKYEYISHSLMTVILRFFLFDISIFQKKHVDGSKVFLTAGKWDVTKIVGYDDDLKIM